MCFSVIVKYDTAKVYVFSLPPKFFRDFLEKSRNFVRAKPGRLFQVPLLNALKTELDLVQTNSLIVEIKSLLVSTKSLIVFGMKNEGLIHGS